MGPQGCLTRDDGNPASHLLSGGFCFLPTSTTVHPLARILTMNTSTPPDVRDADNQDKSPFFRLPNELRLPIYELTVLLLPQHVTRDSDGRYGVSLCIGDHEGPDSCENPPGRLEEHATWSCRLASAWGNHRECEARMLDGFPAHNPMAMLRVCKRL